MRNPWKYLPTSGDRVLAEDAPTVRAFNASASLDTRLRLNLLPEPFVGSRRSARVLWLQLNPGFDGQEAHWHRRAEYSDCVTACLAEKPIEHPFYFLDPRWESSPGGEWYTKRLRFVRDALDERSAKCLSRHLMCVDFVPYHSRRYPDIPVTLPSQRFGFELVRGAIAAGRVIVVGRGARLWRVAVPELADYQLAFELKNPRSAYLSERGLGARRFAVVVEALSAR